MEIKKITCQVRRDLTRESIPDAVLMLHPMRSALAELIGKTASDAEEAINEELLGRLLRDNPEAAKFRERLKVKATFKNGVCKLNKGANVIVERVSVDPDTIFVHALATSTECKELIERIEDVLIEHGVPQATFERHEDSYATETIVILGGSMDALLSERFRAFIEADLTPTAKRDPETQVIIHPFSLALKVHQWQRNAIKPIDAQVESWTLELSHRTFDDHDNNCFKAYSRFDYETHSHLLEQIARCFGAS